MQALTSAVGRTGTNGAPAVGGLTLGGGLGFFYGQVGYTADTAVNFQVSSRQPRMAWP